MYIFFNVCDKYYNFRPIQRKVNEKKGGGKETKSQQQNAETRKRRKLTIYKR